MTYLDEQLKRIKSFEEKSNFLRNELTRKANLALKYRDWLEVWKVPLTISRGDFQGSVLRSIVQHFIPKGWEWEIVDTIATPRGHLILGRYDPYTAGEILIPMSIEYEGEFLRVKFIGGLVRYVYKEHRDILVKCWEACEKLPGEIVHEFMPGEQE